MWGWAFRSAAAPWVVQLLDLADAPPALDRRVIVDDRKTG
jgi:hypothetical protein